ncbi:MAG: efflux RND transporter periplasmic adaptor subunit [Balneolaceae bacterium]
MNKLVKKISIILIVLIITGALAYPKIQHLFSNTTETNNPQNNRQLLKVEAVTPGYSEIEDKIFATGSVLANEDVELSAEESGIITHIYFTEGRPVNKGDLLVKINDSELQAELQRAEFRLTLAEQREERQRRLLERGGISQEDYDATLNEVNILRAELRLINAQIEKTEIRAPFDGIVGLKFVSEGSYISPQTRIATLQDINPVKIDFTIPERYISRVQVGDVIKFNVQGVDSTFTGNVFAIEPRIDSQTRTLRIRALSENEDQLLFPGAFANIELILETIENAVMLPSMAIVPELNAQKVFMFKNGNVIEQRVRTGIRTSDKVQILEGVNAADTVLTTGLLQVRPGDQVEFTKIEDGSTI